jgi:hypothetical protein
VPLLGSLWIVTHTEDFLANSDEIADAKLLPRPWVNARWVVPVARLPRHAPSLSVGRDRPGGRDGALYGGEGIRSYGHPPVTHKAIAGAGYERISATTHRYAALYRLDAILAATQRVVLAQSLAAPRFAVGRPQGRITMQ